MPEQIIDPQELKHAIYESMFGTGSTGFCTKCGESQDGCEPDACNYECESCGAREVYGAEELMIMGYTF